MTKRALFLFLLSALCVSTALAGTKRDVITKLDGKTAGASFYADITNGHAQMFINPSQLPDGSKGYEVGISWNDGSAHEISGLVLSSAVSSTGLSRPLLLNITLDSFYGTGEDPSGNGVSDFTSLVGTFTPYTGVGSQRGSQSGRQYFTHTYLDGSTGTQTTNGTLKSESATFEGKLSVTGGPYDLSVDGPNTAANMYVEVGTQRTVTITP